MSITHSIFLLLLLLLPVLYYGYRRSLVDRSLTQRRVSLGLRSLILVLLVLSLADLHLLQKSDEVAVLFLADISGSVTDEAVQDAQNTIQQMMQGQDLDRVGVMAFANQTKLLRGFDRQIRTSWDLLDTRVRWRQMKPRNMDATDVAHAIETAWGVFPAKANRRLVLMSDGVETKGSAVEVARRSREFGIQIDTIPLNSPEKPEALVERVSLPQRVKQGEPFEVEAVVTSNLNAPARVRLLRNRIEVAENEANLVVGENRLRFSQTLRTPGTASYEVLILPMQDTHPENNRGLCGTMVMGRPRVLLASEKLLYSRHLARALGEADMQLDLRSASAIPGDLSRLEPYDLVILNDVAARHLTLRQMEAFQSYVRDLGGGFVMVGGDHNFGPGGYLGTPVEEFMPVRMDIDDKEESPSLALLLIIDKSGSMAGVKMELAKAAARATVDVLGRRDRIGVIAFDGSPHWVALLRSASDKEILSTQIASIQPGGGTHLYPALHQAYLALLEMPAKLKHVIVLSDGQSSGGDWYNIIGALRSEKVTVSCVGIGDGADMTLMGNLAYWGGGREYFTRDPQEVPQIFVKETTTVVQSAVVDEPFIPQLVRPTPILQGIDPNLMPFLLGYVSTREKPTAETCLVSDRQEPILASWQYGLGRATAFTSDARPRWATEWLNWADFGRFWVQLARHTMRKSSASNFDMILEQGKGQTHLTVEALSESGRFQNDLETELTLSGPRTRPQQLDVIQTAPGRYEADLPVRDPGLYLAHLMQKRRGKVIHEGTVSIAQPYPREYRLRETDEAFLRQLASVTGGQFQPTSESLFRPPDPAKHIRRSLWPIFLTFVAFLLLIDILLRRLDFTRGKV